MSPTQNARATLRDLEHHSAFIERHIGPNDAEIAHMLRIVGHDDIGIVTNITSIINKENSITLRSISINSHDGLFSGMMTVMVDDTSKLELLVKKIKTVKGVKQVNRG